MRGRALPYLLIAPAVLFLALLFFVPLAQTIALAFKTSEGAGWGNFARMADDINFNDAVVNKALVVPRGLSVGQLEAEGVEVARARQLFQRPSGARC